MISINQVQVSIVWPPPSACSDEHDVEELIKRWRASMTDVLSLIGVKVQSIVSRLPFGDLSCLFYCPASLEVFRERVRRVEEEFYLRIELCNIALTR